jgi:hypothetical protein
VKVLIVLLSSLLVAWGALTVSAHAVLVHDDPLWAGDGPPQVACTYWNGLEIRTYLVTRDGAKNFDDAHCTWLMSRQTLAMCPVLGPEADTRALGRRSP